MALPRHRPRGTVSHQCRSLASNPISAGQTIFSSATKSAAAFSSRPQRSPRHSHAPAMLRYAVIGVGINVNHQSFPPELESLATSLRRESGKHWPRELVLTEFLLALETQIALLEAELRGASLQPSLIERFAASSTWVRGKHVSVDEAGGYTGVTDGLDPRGFLRVAGDDGCDSTPYSPAEFARGNRHQRGCNATCD